MELPARVVSLSTALPPHRMGQEEAEALAAGMFDGAWPDLDRKRAVFRNAGVRTRHLAVPPDWFRTPVSFSEKSRLYREAALSLAERCGRDCIRRSGVPPEAVSRVILVSSTGISTPSLEALLLPRLGLLPATARTPLWGLGCAGGAAGLALAAELARARPGERVLLLVVELCSLTFLRNDLSKSNFVAMSLFGDGAAAALLSTEGKGPAVLASRSVTWPGTPDVMGWHVVDEGLQVVFAREIPGIVSERVRPAVDDFLRAQGLSLDRVRHVIAHPGGPKVMAAYARALGRPAADFVHARGVLADCGNMSAPSALFVLERLLSDPSARAGDLGLLTALGPGFTSEMSLLRL